MKYTIFSGSNGDMEHADSKSFLKEEHVIKLKMMS